MYIFAAIIAIMTLIILISYITFRITFLSVRKKHSSLYHGLEGDLSEMKRKRRDMIERIAKIPYEDVTIESYDGLRLRARYYHVREGAPIAIQLHGYKSTSVRDFSGGAYECIKMGHNLLLVDQRAHGESGGHVITFGIKERFDCKAWTEYAVKRFGNNSKIILYGISMGAATALMASELDLPENVVGIVADCPYSSPSAIIKKVCRDRHLPPIVFYPFIKIGARLFGGFNLDSASAVSAVKNTDIPILLIHGSGDNFVPSSMSDEIRSSNPKIIYLKVPDATHGLSFLYDYKAYMKALQNFYKTILPMEE